METIVSASEVSFSVIIPHYIIPDLLARCLDSIPQRDDVQVKWWMIIARMARIILK